MDIHSNKADISKTKIFVRTKNLLTHLCRENDMKQRYYKGYNQVLFIKPSYLNKKLEVKWHGIAVSISTCGPVVPGSNPILLKTVMK